MRNSNAKRVTQYYRVQYISLCIFKYTASQKRALNDYSGNVNITLLIAFGLINLSKQTGQSVNIHYRKMIEISLKNVLNRLQASVFVSYNITAYHISLCKLEILRYLVTLHSI